MSKLKANYPQIILFLTLLGWFAVAFSITVSKAATSIGQIILAATWFLAWDWKIKWTKLKSAPITFWLFLGCYILFVLGLINTEDFKFGFKDLRIKLPFLVLPVIYYTGLEISKKYQSIALILFVLGAFTASFCGVLKNFSEINTVGFDTRELSPFVSHIQLNQALSISVLIIYHFLIQQTNKLKYLLLIPLGWIIYYLSISQSLTALISFSIVVLVIVFYNFYLVARKVSLLVLGIAIIGGTYFTAQIYQIYQLNFDIDEVAETLQAKTKSGNLYQHNQTDLRTENGHFVGLYVQPEELKTAWEKRSDVAFDEISGGYPIKATIIRFLTSKNLPKDAEGIQSLSEEEIKAIESGVANVYYIDHKGIYNRIHRTFWELNKWNTTNYYEASSVVMRFYYWKIGMQIFKDNFWFGVGTGDVKSAFKAQYQITNNELPEKYQRRAHNQYLTSFLTLGLVGGLIFLVICGAIVTIGVKTKSALGIGTMLILLSGLLFEDATETQAGITLFVFGLIWVFGYFKNEKHQKNQMD